MKWQEIYETLQKYDEENRKGWYSYTWANHDVRIAQKSNPSKIYILELYRHGMSSNVARSEELRIKDEMYYWYYLDEFIPFEDLPDADDWYVDDQIFHPYTCMVSIKNMEDVLNPDLYVYKDLSYVKASKLNEKKTKFKALNGIKQFIDAQDWLWYNKRYGHNIENENNVLEVDNCAWCGMSNIEYGLAEFIMNSQEYHICTNGYINKKNKHRRHFKEMEYLFPWKSNGLDPDSTLYISTSSLSLEVNKAALDKRKQKIISDIKFLLGKAGVTEYDIIEIKKFYKYFNL